jgi:hypothetical protein
MKQATAISIQLIQHHVYEVRPPVHLSLLLPETMAYPLHSWQTVQTTMTSMNLKSADFGVCSVTIWDLQVLHIVVSSIYTSTTSSYVQMQLFL